MIKLIRIAVYLGIAFFLFSKARADDVQFEKQKIKIAGQTIEVEIADNPYKRSYGLMNRTELKDGNGMLFIFDEEQPLSFWMKNTLIPLTVGYFDKDKKLFQTVDMKPASPVEVRPQSYPASRPGMYALEVPEGWFARHKVKVGTKFSIIDSAKKKTRQ